MNGTVSGWLSDKVATGALNPDPEQVRAAQALDRVLAEVEAYDPDPGWLGFLKRNTPPKGLYLHGGVGRGKSMLMDVFFRLAAVEAKRRVHFHAFMLDVHDRINRWRKMSEPERRADPYYRRGDGSDPIAPVARSIVEDAALLCFDEFHVTDITDAMILARLFEALWEEGVIVVATSNRAPEDLYKNGLNRGLFLPFIGMMSDHMVIHDFSGETDHRLRQLSEAPVYYEPLGPETRAAMDETWKRLTAGAKTRSTELTVQGRSLRFDCTASGVARESFEALCQRPLGAADYLAVAETFHTLILDGVPRMSREDRNEAKRFVALIDALYEMRSKLVMSADGPPDTLYPSGDGAFEFARTVSRLMEMRSRQYLAEARKVGDGQTDRSGRATADQS